MMRRYCSYVLASSCLPPPEERNIYTLSITQIRSHFAKWPEDRLVNSVYITCERIVIILKVFYTKCENIYDTEQLQ